MEEIWREEIAWRLPLGKPVPGMWTSEGKTYWEGTWNEVTDDDLYAMGYRKQRRKVTDWEDAD